MPQGGGRDAERLDRRSVLQSVGAASMFALAAGRVRGTPWCTSTVSDTDSEQPPAVRGSVEQVVVTDAVQGATLTLYDSASTSLAQAQADARGSYVFRDIEPADGYRVSQTVDGKESPPSEAVRVMSPEYTPTQSFYDAQQLTEGFGYLEVRDGTTLAHQVMLPESHDPPYPTLILHSGYEPSVSVPGGDLFTDLIVDNMGYALVGVNMRGSGCSGGKFDFGERLQRLDGYDMVETIGAQDWAASVGMIGLSFPGFTQLYVAAAQPPSLDAIAPGAPIGDFYRDTAYPGGIENTRFAKEWARDRDEAFEPGGSSGNVDQRIADGDETCEANQQLRLQNRKIVEQMETNPFYEGLFRDRAPLGLLDQITVPTLLVVSWQDEQTGPRAARLFEFLPDDIPKRFVGTNGGHTAYLTQEILDDLFRFYDYYLKETVPDDEGGPYEAALAEYEADPVTIYWERDNATFPPARTARFETTHSGWPPADVETWDLFCQPGGRLAASPPDAVDSETTSYEYTAPIPDEQQLSRDEQNRLQWEERPEDESVAFVSGPLEQNRVCLGSGLVELWLTSAAEDTDVQVTLSEIRPDGQEMFVQMGVLRASRRAEDPERNKPRRPWHTHRRGDDEPIGDGFVHMRVELFPFGHVFREGSRVRIAIGAPGGNRDAWAFDLLDEESTVEIAHTPTMPTKVSLPLIPEIDAEIPDYPACGKIRHQPCRPADSRFVDASGATTDQPVGHDGDETTDAPDAEETTDGDASTDSGSGSPDGGDTESQDADGDGPGFTAGRTLAGLGGAGYLLGRRFGEQTERSD